MESPSSSQDPAEPSTISPSGVVQPDTIKQGKDEAEPTSSSSASEYDETRRSTTQSRRVKDKTRPHFYQLSAEKEEKLRKLYKQLDMDKDGTVDIDDLTAALRRRMPNIPEESHSYAKVGLSFALVWGWVGKLNDQ